jgi:hypothetical protein
MVGRLFTGRPYIACSRRNFVSRLEKGGKMKTSAISLLKRAWCIFIGMALIMTALNVPLFSQEDPDPDEIPSASLTAAKAVLQKMGISLRSELGKASSLARTWVFSAKITDPEKAFKFGFQARSSSGPARVASGTEIFLTVGLKGKVTFYVDSQNKMRTQTNNTLSVTIIESQLASEVGVENSSFPAFAR